MKTHHILLIIAAVLIAWYCVTKKRQQPQATTKKKKFKTLAFVKANLFSAETIHFTIIAFIASVIFGFGAGLIVAEILEGKSLKNFIKYAW